MKLGFFPKLLLSIAISSSSLVFAESTSSTPPTLPSIINRTINQYMTENNIPGAAIAVYQDGKEYYFNYGYANVRTKKKVTEQTIFEIASITKVFTSTLLTIEVQQGKIHLDDPVVGYLPALADTENEPIDSITPIDLATHTASFPRDIQGFGLARGDINGLMTVLQTWEPNYPIGTKFLYSNISFGLLGTVLQNAANQPYYNLISQYILSPLNMTNTFVDVPKEKQSLIATGYNKKDHVAPFFHPTSIVGGGELVSSSADLMQFLKANLCVQTGSATPELLSAMNSAQQPFFKVKDNFTMALGWQRIMRNNTLFITKDGANRGFNSFIGFVPSKKLGIVILFNRNGLQTPKLGMWLLNRIITQLN